jgi:hypothetical protein
MSICLRAASIGSALLILAAIVSGQSETATAMIGMRISGRVVEATRAFISAASVKLKTAPDQKIIGTTSTNENGEFVLVVTVAANTILQLAVEAPGFIPIETTVNGNGQTTMSISTIVMQPNLVDAVLVEQPIVTLTTDPLCEVSRWQKLVPKKYWFWALRDW